MKYNVGDKVRVREDLSAEHGASAIMVKKWAGKVVTIDEVEPINPLFGKMRGAYTIVEDDSDRRIKYLWKEDCFVEKVNEKYAEVKPDNEMPELVTGMFGVEDDGDIFVVVGKTAVHQSGLYEMITDKSWYDNIIALYDGHCFDQIADGFGTLIWERSEEDTEVKEANIEDETREKITKLLDALFETYGDKK